MLVVRPKEIAHIPRRPVGEEVPLVLREPGKATQQHIENECKALDRYEDAKRDSTYAKSRSRDFCARRSRHRRRYHLHNLAHARAVVIWTSRVACQVEAVHVAAHAPTAAHAAQRGAGSFGAISYSS